MTPEQARRARAKRPFPLWVDSWKRDTWQLAPDEQMAYLNLLFHMWASPGLYLPDTPHKLAIAADVSTRLWTQRMDAALRPFLCQVPGGLSQRRLMKEAAQVEAFLILQSQRSVAKNSPKLL